MHRQASPHTIISVHSRTFRCFRWCLDVVDRWKGAHGNYAQQFEYGAKLYQFRRMFLWAFLAVLTNWFTYGWVLYMIFYIPAKVSSLGDLLFFWFVLIVSSIAFLTLTLTLVTWAKSSIERIEIGNHTPGFFTLFKKSLLSLIHREPAMITFTNEEEKERREWQ